jgi:hypothetical protein
MRAAFGYRRLRLEIHTFAVSDFGITENCHFRKEPRRSLYPPRVGPSERHGERCLRSRDRDEAVSTLEHERRN